MNRPSTAITLLMRHRDLGSEVWIKWDETTEIYELFASRDGDDYLGCADTEADARAFARDHFNDLMSR